MPDLDELNSQITLAAARAADAATEAYARGATGDLHDHPDVQPHNDTLRRLLVERDALLPDDHEEFALRAQQRPSAVLRAQEDLHAALGRLRDRGELSEDDHARLAGVIEQSAQRVGLHRQALEGA